MNISTEDFLVFEIYSNAGEHAFSRGEVTEVHKDSYDRIFRHLRDAVDGAVARSLNPDDLATWNCRFGRDGGIQGQRPVDLWASIINADSDGFSRFPQVYAIASETGVEIGFSVTIHENDYYNQSVKRKNRSIVPIINAKLPTPDSPLVADIANILDQGGWKYGEKNRQGPVSSFGSLSDLLTHLKSGQSTNRGGGSIYRILSFEDVAGKQSLLEDELTKALAIFRPLMEMLRPTSTEAAFAGNLQLLADFAENLAPYDPKDDEEGKKQVLRAVAIRQGQAKFRDDLLQAYESKCAISGCKVAATLQAAHISPFNGKGSNHVSNGLLLRADIHTLFDLGLIKIDPRSRTVLVAPSLKGSIYEEYSGKLVSCPARAAHRPSKAALIKKIEMFPAG